MDPAVTEYTPVLFTAADVAHVLGVTNAAVSQWVRQRENTPPPAYRVRAGATGFRYLWDDAGMRLWRQWLDQRKRFDPYWRANR
jgi:hypothetical protein